MRVHQWLKNFFIFLPLIFSSEFLILSQDLKNILAFISFCFMASCVYILNDIKDVEDDRKHDTKKNRPIASGVISVNSAILLAVVLFITAITIGLLLNTSLLLILIVYFGLNILYTIYLKHLPVIDIVVLAFFYIIRVFAGGVVTGVEISSWLMLTTFFIALFLGSGKRYVELMKNGSAGRRVLESYNSDFLKYVLSLSSFSTILFYALYTITHGVYFEFSIVFVVLGFMLYFYELYSGKIVDDPVSALIKSKRLLIFVTAWGTYMLIILVLKL
jgi:4-hydroxybenzoate polyprenyltransferase